MSVCGLQVLCLVLIILFITLFTINKQVLDFPGSGAINITNGQLCIIIKRLTVCILNPAEQQIRQKQPKKQKLYGIYIVLN